MIAVSVPKDACTTYPNWKIKKSDILRYNNINHKLWVLTG